MTQADIPRTTERLMIRLGSGFAEMSIDTYDPGDASATILCLHDYWGNARDFERVGGFLSAHGYRVVCPDLFGRGDSANLQDSERYRTETFLVALTAVMQHFEHKRIAIIGKGMGALTALLLNVRLSFDFDRLVVADMPLTVSLDSDRVPQRDQLEFATLDEARQAARNLSDLADSPEPEALILAEGRIKPLEGGRYALRFDPALVEQVLKLEDRSFNTSQLLTRIRSPLLFLAGSELQPKERATLDVVLRDRRGVVADRMATGDGRVHFTTNRQLLMLLGFLQSRLLVEA